MPSDLSRTNLVAARSIPQHLRALLAAAVMACCVAFVPTVAAADFEQASAAYARGDYADARRQFEALARAGDAVAQVYVAVMFERGQGVPVDYREAARWYRSAAERGLADGQFNLGLLYSKGLGVGRDHVTAARWYRLAAAQGHVRAQLNLGVAYEMGRGLPRDPVAAAGWYRQAARSGNADAQFNLARLYSTGTGVAADATAATEWYREAAQSGHVAAQLNLGMAYESGRGVAANRSEAISWYRMAAAKGDATAIARLRALGATLEETVVMDPVPAAAPDRVVAPAPTHVVVAEPPAAPAPVRQERVELPSATRERIAAEVREEPVAVVREEPAAVAVPLPDAPAREDVDEPPVATTASPSLWSRLFAQADEPAAVPEPTVVVPEPTVFIPAPTEVVPEPTVAVVVPTPVAVAPEPTVAVDEKRVAPRATVTPGAWSRFWGRDVRPAPPTAVAQPLVVDVEYPEEMPVQEDVVVEVPPTPVRIVKSDLGVRPIVEDSVASSQPPVEIEVIPQAAEPAAAEAAASPFWGWWSRLTGARPTEPAAPKTAKLQRLKIEDLTVVEATPVSVSAEAVRGSYGVAVEAEPAASIVAYEKEILPSLPAGAEPLSDPDMDAAESGERVALQRLPDALDEQPAVPAAEVAVAHEVEVPAAAAVAPVVVSAVPFETVMEQAIGGDAAAQFEVAGLYLRGDGTDEDPVAAAAWYLESAQRGDARAQAQLGVLLDNGRGVGRDPVAAVEWYRRAAEQGNPLGQVGLARKYDKGEGVARDTAQAARLYRQAALQGNTLAQVNLGVSYATGEGVKRDPVEALSWLTQAGLAGDATALQYKDIVAANLSAADIRKAEARAASRR